MSMTSSHSPLAFITGEEPDAGVAAFGAAAAAAAVGSADATVAGSVDAGAAPCMTSSYSCPQFVDRDRVKSR